MGELEWDAKARREWRKFIADERLAQGIETGTDETRSGSVSEADESPVACDAPNSSRPTQEDRSDGN
jgi:hypothetical protein